MKAGDPDVLRRRIRATALMDEGDAVMRFLQSHRFDQDWRQSVRQEAGILVERTRQHQKPGLMTGFLAEYGLDSSEGLALMTLAEALLRIPDNATRDALINDCIRPGHWSVHRGHSPDPVVNASTWALELGGRIMNESGSGVEGAFCHLLRHLGEPVFRHAAMLALRELGNHFVLGSRIEEAMARAAESEAQGYRFSYDMLGEAARTRAAAENYLEAYRCAITGLASGCRSPQLVRNAGISVKLSALHPRYEYCQKDTTLPELIESVRELAHMAAAANMGLNIDAEEADRLELSLDVVAALLADPALQDWHGLGVVVQAYNKRAPQVIDWLYSQAGKRARRIMVRLVKGAYWDYEIKRAQAAGLQDFPVYTRKAHTDIAWLGCAAKLLDMADLIYPQFATHNAHSVAAVLNMARHLRVDSWEFQRLQGMGEELYRQVMADQGVSCRIYAPVGEHQDLLAYLVRRLLENGANSSFVNQLANYSIPASEVVRDPYLAVINDQNEIRIQRGDVCLPVALYGNERLNSRGLDLGNPLDLDALLVRQQFLKQQIWLSGPLLAGGAGELPVRMQTVQSILNPANEADLVGHVTVATAADIGLARTMAATADSSLWPLPVRVECLRRIADAYEAHRDELLSLLCREAGKTWGDAVAELREAVDFCRYYAARAEQMERPVPLGVVACISPWNFPLAIFTGQIVAALVCGNRVLAKPAPQTPLIAARAVQLMLMAGVPDVFLQLLPGGADVGESLLASDCIDGVCFTGSHQTARRIAARMAHHQAVDAPLIAETGGINCMLVDSSALPEQVVRDVLVSAFQSAGQRCSALRVLLLQEEIADQVLTMLGGALQCLRPGDPSDPSTDIGPLIDREAYGRAHAWLQQCRSRGWRVQQLDRQDNSSGCLMAPAMVEVDSLDDVPEEIFAPILHVVRYSSGQLDDLVERINRSGFGLTCCIHSRLQGRVEDLVKRLEVGNLYVNRNQIGAVVGSQPFGGEKCSGTGPKAGGPLYLTRFCRPVPSGYDNGLRIDDGIVAPGAPVLQQTLDQLRRRRLLPEFSRLDWRERNARLDTLMAPLGIAVPQVDMHEQCLPGPTGEVNRYRLCPRGVLLCVADCLATGLQQAVNALATGNAALMLVPGLEDAMLPISDYLKPLFTDWPLVPVSGRLDAGVLEHLVGLDGLVACADAQSLRLWRQALARRDGPIMPMITDAGAAIRLVVERHVCIDATAVGGNAALVARVH